MIRKVYLKLPKHLERWLKLILRGYFLSKMIKFRNDKFKKGGVIVYGRN